MAHLLAADPHPHRADRPQEPPARGQTSLGGWRRGQPWTPHCLDSGPHLLEPDHRHHALVDVRAVLHSSHHALLHRRLGLAARLPQGADSPPCAAHARRLPPHPRSRRGPLRRPGPRGADAHPRRRPCREGCASGHHRTSPGGGAGGWLGHPQLPSRSARHLLFRHHHGLDAHFQPGAEGGCRVAGALIRGIDRAAALWCCSRWRHLPTKHRRRKGSARSTRPR
mmetsp:Transcript_75497/g.179324  ORF Transcript_75497/g.179324 Transcript_75497/m.179324 type:complete len:224 (+) Transcript_75497:1213-1884(+)